MSVDLEDLKRLKLTKETMAWLRAQAHITGESKQDIARDALHEIAVQKIKAAKILTSMAPDEGRARDAGGRSGDGGANGRDSRGRSR